MTRFFRSGYWRTSIYGVKHRVEGHPVERDVWERSGGTAWAPSFFAERLREARAWSSATARVVVPNATCPVCGADVFFYRNEHGSKVYFDELGPPWPKHPCTDSAPSRGLVNRQKPSGSAAPMARALDDVELNRHWDERGEFEPEFDFGHRYGTGRWTAWRVARRMRSPLNVCLILTNVEARRPRRAFVCLPHLPRALGAGDLVFLNRGWLAFLDRGTLEPVEVEISRLAGAQALVEELASDRLEENAE